ncbi:MAG: methionyl-tRNA formyltransferase [Bacteroidia bacterium]
MANDLNKEGYKAIFLTETHKIIEGDILILLSCEKRFQKLHLNKHNLVVHESALPKGKGWSPLTWQVLEGKNKMPVTLIEALEKIDSGPIYDQIIIQLDGTELIDELRKKQAEATSILITGFIKNYPDNFAKKQKGDDSFYVRRNPEHSRLDINKTIAEQFNLLRVCDNERYPAWFEIKGQKYLFKISKAKND